MTDNYDQLALSWVRKEINNTLDQARQGLDTFVEDKEDQTQIQFCINSLHQVHGSLQMLGFDGAARLAAEMETLADKFANGEVELNESSYEILMRSMMQMPGYLERVEGGQKDIPVILLPLINELRSTSNLEPVKEESFFVAQTESVEPPKPNEQLSDQEKNEAFQETARKLRAHFQKGLTGIIRSKQVKESLARVHKVLLRLEALTEGHSVARLWWVADGFIFSIAEKGLYKSKEVHALLGKVDIQIKRLADVGEEALNDEIPPQILSKLLYFVARSTSLNERVVSLKKEFNLEESLPESGTIKKQRQQLARPDSAAMKSVVGAIGEEIASVKDQLDLFVRAKAKEPSQLKALSDSLARIADTLTLLELPIPRDVIRVQVATLQKSIKTSSLPDDSAIMDIAGALLFVDANLSNVDLDRFTDEENKEDATEIGEQRSKEKQVDDATIALIAVSRKNLQLAKDGMINYIASAFNQEELVPVPALLNEVLGAMKIIEFSEASDVLRIAETFVKQCLIDVEQPPSEQYLDALADIVTSVDYYLEGMEEDNNKAIISILHSAQVSQDLLVSAIDNMAQAGVVEEELGESSDNLDNTGTQPTEIQVETGNVIPFNQKSAEKEIDESLIDEEVLEIFLEEAEEEIEVLEQTLVIWINNLKDKDALTTIRRSFHTLKGSGRLVGASTIGELAWSVENMLNKVLEGAVPAENPVISLLNNALAKLPKLVEEFSNTEVHQGSDIDELIARAEHLAKGLNLSDFVFEEIISEEQTNQEPQEVLVPTLSEQVDSSAEDEPIDPVLLEIFVTEAQVHLKAINRFIETRVADAGVKVTDDLIRALHTLKGSAHMAKVDAIAKIATPIEKYARITKGGNRKFESDAMQLLEDSSKFLSKVIDNLIASQPIEVEELGLLLERINQLTKNKQADVENSGSLNQRDQQLVSIFLTEGADILQEVGSLLAEFKNNPDESTMADKISSELHVFKRGSEMIGVDELQMFASTCESVSRLQLESEDDINEYHRLLNAGIDELSQMLNKLVSEEDIQLPNALNEEMKSWVTETSRTGAPEEMDQELVELFVEEADELTESAQGLLERWSEHLDSEEITKELRRIYHTFKGSSRMAGAMNIGELAFVTEEIFNTHMDFGREISDVDHQLVHMATNKLIEMVNVLRTFTWPVAANDEVNQIKKHIDPKHQDISDSTEVIAKETVVEKVEEEVPVVIGENPEETAVEDPVTEKQVAEELAEEEVIETVEEYIEEAVEEVITDEIEEAQIDTEIESVREEKETVSRKDSKDAVVTEDTIAPAKPLVSSGNVYSIDLDEDGLEVLEIYLEEADELLIALDEAMNLWGEDLANSEAIDTMQRTLHTFKGGARLADLVVLGDLTHEMETYFEMVNTGTLQAKQSHVSFMLQGYDVIESLVNEVKNHNQMTMPEDYFSGLKKIISGEEIDSYEVTTPSETTKEETQKEQGKQEKATISSKDKSNDERSADIVSFEKHKQQQQEDDRRKQTNLVDTVRVNSSQIEDLVNLAGETSIFRSRLEQQMSVLRYNLDEMSSTVDRLKDQLRNLDIETEAQISYRREISGGTEYEDFDPLEMDRYTRQQELTRGLGESAVDLMNLKETLDFLTSDSETLLLQQGRVNTEMQESLMQTRMTPFESLVPRLRRMVRQISTELGKTIELSISADGEMDRNVLERMIAPLEHMLRNAMDHGIESPSERKKKKKAETGKINISLYREGSEVFIKIRDDGRGLNLDAIKKKAIERGLITKDTVLNQHELQQLVLEAGFSTAEKVTQISGRGVGMDVVNSEIKQLGGIIEIDSEKNQGSTFTVRLPFTVSVNQALMVKIGEEVYAIPLSNIEGIVRVSPFELEEYYENSETKFAYAGIDYSMYYLGQMLDHHSKANLEGVSQALPVLLLHGADHPTALQVDDLLGSREIVVKSIGSQLSSVSGLSGATIQGDGRVVLILDMPALIRRVDAQIAEPVDYEEAVQQEKMPTVMVVDDSITVRKVTTRLLERYDFEVVTAKDGVDAVTVLADVVPDVMLLDIEMPRMDGFELATIIRHDERLKNIPIIMITSRTGEKHRERAEAIGVNQYMGKPYNEVDLLDTINDLLADNS